VSSAPRTLPDHHGRRHRRDPAGAELPPGRPRRLERGGDRSAEIGTWIGLLGGLVWTAGAFLLAKESEGDDDWADERVTTGRTAH
jgi:hypothetical protein